jgi:hypothetical protein
MIATDTYRNSSHRLWLCIYFIVLKLSLVALHNIYYRCKDLNKCLLCDSADDAAVQHTATVRGVTVSIRYYCLW